MVPSTSSALAATGTTRTGTGTRTGVFVSPNNTPDEPGYNLFTNGLSVLERRVTGLFPVSRGSYADGSAKDRRARFPVVGLGRSLEPGVFQSDRRASPLNGLRGFLCTHDSKADVHVTVGGSNGRAVGHAAQFSLVLPIASPNNSLCSGCRTARKLRHVGAIRSKLVFAPLPNIARHVVRTFRAGPAWKKANGRRMSGETAVVQQSRVWGAVAPGVPSPVAAARRSLPLGLRRQLAASPTAVGMRFVPGDPSDGTRGVFQLSVPVVGTLE